MKYMIMDCRIFCLRNNDLEMLYRRPGRLVSRQFWQLITHTVREICDSSRRKLTAPNLTATCNSLSRRKSMRCGGSVMIVGPILLTSKTLKSSFWKNGVWPIGYFPIAVSVLVAFGTIGIIKLINAYYSYWSYNNWYWYGFASLVANLT